nr:Chain B, Hexapeptide PGLWKS [synthetic construct]
PGLWKS